MDIVPWKAYAISEQQKQNRVLAPYAEKEQTSMEDSTPSTSQSSPCSKSHVDEFTAEATETNLLF